MLIFGIQRTRVLWDIVKRNRGTRAGLLRAGWVSHLSSDTIQQYFYGLTTDR